MSKICLPTETENLTLPKKESKILKRTRDISIFPYSSQCLDSRANFPREMASCRELLFRELISISFGYMRFRYVALQLSLLKVDYTEIMKRVLKNREKSLRSEKMNAKGKASSTVS